MSLFVPENPPSLRYWGTVVSESWAGHCKQERFLKALTGSWTPRSPSSPDASRPLLLSRAQKQVAGPMTAFPVTRS